MTYTLTLCIGMFMSICGQLREADFPSYEVCDRERQAQVKRGIGSGYAVCAPKGALKQPAKAGAAS
jgi:hypothetical protein